SGVAAAAATVAPAPSVRRNSRRPSVLLRSRFIAVSSYIRFCSPRCSRGQRESIGFDLYKHPADPSYSPVEIRRFGPFQIGKEAPDPRSEMLLEELAIGTGGSREAAARKPRHDPAQERRVILGPPLTPPAFEPELAQMRAQARERTLVQEAGEIIRSVGQKFPAPETDEKIEIFALEALDIGALRRLCERDVRQSERACIAGQCAEALEQPGVGRACEQHREQRVFLRPRCIDLVDIPGRAGLFGVEMGP